MITNEDLDRVVSFHGHLCPGLARGIRAAEIASREIGSAEDEDVVAVLESVGCSVDAIQFLLGCTVGKGNLILQDYGRHVFTFARRVDGRAIRLIEKESPLIALSEEEERLLQRGRAPDATDQERRAFQELWTRLAETVLRVAEEELFIVEELSNYPLPEKAPVRSLRRCDSCGVLTMETRLHRLRGRCLCISCYEREIASAIVCQPIGIVRSAFVEGSPRQKGRGQAEIEIYPEYARGLEGICENTWLQVIFAFDRAPAEPPLLQHPRGDRAVPKRGVFALRSPHRPNPLGLTTVRLRQVRGNILKVDGLDAWDGTPVLDIKPYVAGLDEGL
ncbi:MAG: tRNA (N6-threonylcarbamoyladenosine(37)-N6)-methyltransferase TrmO [Anaerolineae bacterium]|nr:tRNA (N6-threonylcarbamoyladenosine(37)-N6)-methyltransferase TrmO [Anaerolineae bacterium]